MFVLGLHEMLSWLIPNVTTFLTLLASALALIFVYRGNTKSNLPRGPGGLPIVGFLPFMTTKPYIVFRDLAKKYGSIFSLYLGRKYVIVLGNNSAAKEALSKSSILGRPSFLPFHLVPGGIGFAEINGHAWQEQRSFSLRILRDLGFGKSPAENLIQEEVADFLKHLDKECGTPMDVGNLLTSSISNVITGLIFGRRLNYNDPMRKSLNEAADTVVQTLVQSGALTFFPMLQNRFFQFLLDPFGTKVKSMSTIKQFVKAEIAKQKKKSSDSSWCYLSIYLKQMENLEGKEETSSFTEDMMIGNVQSFFVGGTETTKTSLIWSFLIMATYPEIQRKVQKEIDEIVGKDRVPCWDDKSRLNYVSAVIQEVQRWKAIVPLGVLRLAMDNTSIAGFFVPKDTTIIINIWAVCRDPECWQNPDSFIPERHLSEDGKVMKKEGYIPFSCGRRSCPGESLAYMEMFIFFAAVLQRYTITTPGNRKPDLEEIFSNTLQPKAQKLCYKKRI